MLLIDCKNLIDNIKYISGLFFRAERSLDPLKVFRHPVDATKDHFYIGISGYVICFEPPCADRQ